MNLRALRLKRAYSSDYDDILHEFYVPALSVSVAYDRLAGFFSSTSLAIAARGVVGLVANGGVIRLLVSPRLSREDVAAITDSSDRRDAYLERRMLAELDALEDEFVRDHIFALAWMVANRRLEIKAAIAYDEAGYPLSHEDVEQTGLFHQKVGILTDGRGDVVTFSGSVNETAAGWLRNIEEFKVFRSWETSEGEYVEADLAKFRRFWQSESRRVRVVDIPTAVTDRLVAIAPAQFDAHSIDSLYEKAKHVPTVQLFPEQRRAVDAWVANGMRGVFEMATGTGKTFAALGCLHSVLESAPKVVAVITCPYQHLLSQWQREIGKFGLHPDALLTADSVNPQWRTQLSDCLIDVAIGHKSVAIVLTTHDTFSSDEFVTIVRTNTQGLTLFVIGDEVHGLGAQKRRRGLLEEYHLRLGVSATPRRWFDELGTDALYAYFGDTVHEFGLAEAVTTLNPATGQTYLAAYRYVPRFVTLTDAELEEYVGKTKAIVARYARASDDEEMRGALERLLFTRASIVKAAARKYEALRQILDELPSPVQWMLVYCVPQQLDEVMQIINGRHLVAHRFTMQEGTTPEQRYQGLSERDFLLGAFASGRYQTLVAMKCLDEGVDVPPARTAILMGSSGNPREYIQRIGRVLRHYPGKTEAVIHDIVVVPTVRIVPDELRVAERRVFEKELLRCTEIARVAINGAEAYQRLCEIHERVEEARL
jgi:superfamily II DNA or RNA helicase